MLATGCTGTLWVIPMTEQPKQRKTPGRFIRTAENLFHNPELHDEIMGEWAHPTAGRRTPKPDKPEPTVKELQAIMTEKEVKTRKAPSRLKKAATRIKKEVRTVGRGIDAMWSDPEQHAATLAAWGGPAAGARRTPSPDEPEPHAATARQQEMMPPNVVINVHQAAGVPMPEVGQAARPPASPQAKRTEPSLDDILQSPEGW